MFPFIYSFYLLNTETNSIFLSMVSPISPIIFPIVNAAATVPIPRPEMCPKQRKVMQAVRKRQVTSNVILTLE